MTSPTDDRNLTTREVAEILCMTEGGLRWWRHVGRGPFSFKSGRRTLYPLSGVQAWQRQQKDTTGRAGNLEQQAS